MKPRSRTGRKGQRGFLLITVYWIVAVMVMHGVVLVTYAIADLRAAQRAQASLQAVYQAEAGVDQAITQMRANAAWAGGAGAAGGTGTFAVGVQALGANQQRISVQGNVNLAGGTVTRSLESIMNVTPGTGVPPGMFADLSVNLNGSVRVDSYDSRQPVFRSTNRGMVGTNSTQNEAIRINGAVDVFGDVRSGPGAPAGAIRITGASRVSGQVGPNTQLYPMALVSEPLGNEALRLNGHDTLTLPGGVYHFSSITINGGAKLTFTGPATVYTGSFILNGNGIASADEAPPNLSVKVVGAGRVTLNGATDFYGHIYAPESEVTLNGNNELFGAITSKRLVGNGSVKMWYDEALNSGGGGTPNTVQVLSWTEPGI